MTDFEGAYGASQWSSPPFHSRHVWATPLKTLPRIMPALESNPQFAVPPSSSFCRLHYWAIPGFQHRHCCTQCLMHHQQDEAFSFTSFLLYPEVPTDRTTNLWTHVKLSSYRLFIQQRTVHLQKLTIDYEVLLLCSRPLAALMQLCCSYLSESCSINDIPRPGTVGAFLGLPHGRMLL